MSRDDTQHPPVADDSGPLLSVRIKLLLVLTLAGMALAFTGSLADDGSERTVGDTVTVEVRETNILSSPSPDGIEVVSTSGTASREATDVEIVVRNTGDEPITVSVGWFRGRTSFRTTSMSAVEPFEPVDVRPGERATLAGSVAPDEIRVDALDVEYILFEIVDSS